MIVNGRGPVPAKIMVVGEQPGPMEAETGIPFYPKAAVGKELTRYLHQIVQVHRDGVYLTNLVKEYEKDHKVKAEDVARWGPILEEELTRVKPQLIIALGREATRYFLGDVNVEDVYGLPHKWEASPRDGNGHYHFQGAVVVPSYLRLYDTELQPLVWYSFLQARRYLDGKIEPHSKSRLHQKHFSYFNAAGTPEVDRVALSDLVAVDTEGLPGKPWGLSFSALEKQAAVIRVGNRDALVRFKDKIRHATVILHNALYDLRILRDMGIEITRFHDTMLMAFLLGLEPLGLKALAYRYRGIDRQSFEEVVGPTANELATEWLEKVLRYCPWELVDPSLDGKKSRWSIVRRIENILGTFAGLVVYRDGPTDKKSMAAMKKRLFEAGVRGAMRLSQNTWGWEGCLVTRPVKAEIEKIPEIDTSELKRRDGAKDPARRWKVVCAEHPEQTDMVEAAMEAMPEPGLDTVEERFGAAGQKTATEYSAGDADDTWSIFPILWKQVQELKLEEVYNLDIQAMPMIDRMMDVGFMANRDYFKALAVELDLEIATVGQEIDTIAGHPLNPSSPQQVAGYLFDELKLPVQDWTPEGQRSTTDEVIESLRLVEDYPVLQKISDYRELVKMKSTYADKLWRRLGKDDRIHPRLRLTRVPSGRLACSEPNLMAIPVRSQRVVAGKKLGVAIRDGFIAAPGHLLGSWDLDQIEMRVLAHCSQDENLVDVFQTGQDIHKKTASLVFGIPMTEVQDWQRTSAKAVGFGIVYGQSAGGLQLQMKLRGIDRTEAECQRMIDSYLEEAYPGVKRLMEEKQREGRKLGYVRSMMGRLRYLPQLHSHNMRLRSEADRICLNHTIQTTAQEIIKLGMVGIWQNVLPAIWAEGWYCQPLLQIHDELVLEFDEGIRDELDVLIRTELENALRLSVPIGSKSHFARTWGGLK